MADDDDLVDYDEEVVDPSVVAASSAANGKATEAKKGSYVGVHASGFKDFLLKPELYRAVTDCGFEHPSEVQHECIPQAVLGMDIICQAKPGMGKTAVFVLATLHQLTPEPSTISVLVLCHTRELAFQIHHEYQRFSKYLKEVKCEVFFGGTPIPPQQEILKNNCPNIVIGTPGRILDLANRKFMDLSKVKHFVIDECDRVLGPGTNGNLGMRKDVQEIFSKTPHEKQVLMFSATLPKEIRPVCKKFTQDALEVYIDDDSKLILHGLQQYYVELKEEEKNRKLTEILDNLDFNQVIVFVSKSARAEELGRLLKECGFPAIVTHAGLDNKIRLERLEFFKQVNARILVTTDLFGRGIDLERVNISISYDMAADADSHLHRINRAGRFGTKGLAISFCSSPADKDVLDTIQSRFAIKIEQMPAKIDPSTYMVA